MPANKDRIYVCLLLRSGKPQMPGLEDTYHWALAVGPKTLDSNAGARVFHAKNVAVSSGDGAVQMRWEFQERQTSMNATSMILVRVQFGKVASMKRLESILRSVPVSGSMPGWNCVAWVRDGIERLNADGKVLGTCVTEWNTIRNAAMRYVEEKRVQRRFESDSHFNKDNVPTWSLLVGKELVP